MPEVGWTQKVAKEWSEYQPPSRPSKSEINIFKSHFKKLPKRSKVLVLGSTPELRNLAAICEMDITVVDWSEDITKALKLLVENKNYPEKFSKQNWTDMEFDKKFDLIVGDCALTVVSFKELEVVLKKIKSHLSKSGFALQRIWVRSNEDNFSLEDIEKIYKNKPAKMHWYTELLFPVFLHYYDKQRESLSGEEIYNKMKIDFENKKISKEIFDLFDLVKNHKTPNNVLRLEHLKSILSKHFNIVSIEYGNDIFKKNSPIFTLKQLQ